MKKRIGVLLSGRGSNFEALAESAAAGRIPNAEMAIVISNREGAPGIARAKTRGIATRVIPSKGLEREVYDRLVAAVLDEHLDAGPIIVQAVVPVKDDDTEASLSERILTEEHRIYSEAVRIVLEGKYKIAGRRVLRF